MSEHELGFVQSPSPDQVGSSGAVAAVAQWRQWRSGGK